jgi:hypothetical protein
MQIGSSLLKFHPLPESRVSDNKAMMIDWNREEGGSFGMRPIVEAFKCEARTRSVRRRYTFFSVDEPSDVRFCILLSVFLASA